MGQEQGVPGVMPELPPDAEPKIEPQLQKTIVIANSTAANERKRKAKRNLVFLVAGVIIVGGVVWYIGKISSPPLQKIAAFSTSLAPVAQQNVSNYPAPLKAAPATAGITPAKATPKNSALTVAGVIADTNTERAQNNEDGNLTPLAESKTLDAIATLRLDDMFENQYFAHVSPTGASAVTVASSVGYGHLALGENLAEGIFAGDQGVVTAWMNSPGHRANILDTHYTEIGVAVREGTFDGQQTWIAVQVFGKPTSACPAAPDPQLEAAITAAEAELTQMSNQLKQMQASVEAMQPQSGDAYNQAVAQYNAQVSTYNTLGTNTKTEVTQYNAEVDAYNACL
jgi:uncharacterized protein YkwD